MAVKWRNLNGVIFLSSQSSDMKAMAEKITALSNALQAMTESKAKTEAVFQADKKAMLVIY